METELAIGRSEEHMQGNGGIVNSLPCALRTLNNVFTKLTMNLLDINLLYTVIPMRYVGSPKSYS